MPSTARRYAYGRSDRDDVARGIYGAQRPAHRSKFTLLAGIYTPRTGATRASPPLPWTRPRGALTPTGWTEVDPVPRAFSLDPTGRFLYAAGLETGNLTGFRIDQGSGKLTQLETYAVGAVPMWVLIARLADKVGASSLGYAVKTGALGLPGTSPQF